MIALYWFSDCLPMELRCRALALAGLALLVLLGSQASTASSSELSAQSRRLLAPIANGSSVPDAIKDIVPKLALEGVSITVKYPTFEAKDGILVSPVLVAKPPNITITGASANKSYALVFVDPGPAIPDLPPDIQYLHGLIVNIPGGDVAKGDTLMSYMGSAPPEGVHRYLFVLYEQPKIIPPKPLEQRGGFDLAKYAAKQNLGLPVAVTFFTAQPDQ